MESYLVIISSQWPKYALYWRCNPWFIKWQDKVGLDLESAVVVIYAWLIFITSSYMLFLTPLDCPYPIILYLSSSGLWRNFTGATFRHGTCIFVFLHVCRASKKGPFMWCHQLIMQLCYCLPIDKNTIGYTIFRIRSFHLYQEDLFCP